jgi:DNA invertase Pin-like site-specific DNA recombinase
LRKYVLSKSVLEQAEVEMKVAIYARVSTKDKQQDPELQLRDLRAYCSQRDWDFTEYVDIGVSGARSQRPQLDQLMQAVEAKQVQAVLVWRFDRFARSVLHLEQTLQLFQRLGCQFISYQEQIDTGTPAGKVMFTVIAAMAEFERNLIRERTKAGMSHAKSKGSKIGREPLALDHPEIERLFNAGESVRSIAKRYPYELKGKIVYPRRAVSRFLGRLAHPELEP